MPNKNTPNVDNESPIKNVADEIFKDNILPRLDTKSLYFFGSTNRKHHLLSKNIMHADIKDYRLLPGNSFTFLYNSSRILYAGSRENIKPLKSRHYKKFVELRNFQDQGGIRNIQIIYRNTFVFCQNGKVFCFEERAGTTINNDKILPNTFTEIPTFSRLQREKCISQIVTKDNFTIILCQDRTLYRIKLSLTDILGLNEETFFQELEKIKYLGDLIKSDDKVLVSMVDYLILMAINNKIFLANFFAIEKNSNILNFTEINNVPCAQEKGGITYIKLEGPPISYHVIGSANIFIVYGDGHVFVSGNNEYGSLGLGHTWSQDTFTQIAGLTQLVGSKDIKIKDIQSINNSTSILYTNGIAVSAGYTGRGKLGIGETKHPYKKENFFKLNDLPALKNQGPIRQIALSNLTQFLQMENGAIFAVGDNGGGKLASSDPSKIVREFIKVRPAYKPISPFSILIKELNSDPTKKIIVLVLEEFASLWEKKETSAWKLKESEAAITNAKNASNSGENEQDIINILRKNPKVLTLFESLKIPLPNSTLEENDINEEQPAKYARLS